MGRRRALFLVALLSAGMAGCEDSAPRYPLRLVMLEVEAARKDLEPTPEAPQRRRSPRRQNGCDITSFGATRRSPLARGCTDLENIASSSSFNSGFLRRLRIDESGTDAGPVAIHVCVDVFHHFSPMRSEEFPSVRTHHRVPIGGLGPCVGRSIRALCNDRYSSSVSVSSRQSLKTGFDEEPGQFYAIGVSSCSVFFVG